MSFDTFDGPPPIDPSTATTGTSRDGVSGLSAQFDSTEPGAVHIAPEAPPTSVPSGLRTKRPTRPSRHKVSKVTKPPQRSLSSPHLRGLTMSDSDADKKRNKLGYQRISIACDPHGRCQNCIRLKKECVFYPVDQQGTIDSTPQSAGEGGAGSGPSSAVSSSTPPEAISGTTFNGSHEREGFPVLPSNAPSSYTGFPMGLSSGTLSPGNNAHSSHRNEHAFNHYPAQFAQPRPVQRHHPDSQSPWMGASGFQYPMSMPHPSANQFSEPNYYRQGLGASPGDYAPFPYNATTASANTQNPYAFSQQRTNQFWSHSQQQQQQQARSLSYSHAEGFGQNADPYLGLHFDEVQQPSQSLLRHAPPALEMQNASMIPHAQGPHSAPIAQHPHGFMDQHAFSLQDSPFQSNSGLTSTNPDFGGTFYRTSPQLGTLQENRSISPGGTPIFAHHSSQPG
ncbi:uncharacterized protein LTR77_000191 [Saxophila tyrrhenica]|uniref:Zn(2)-C6 fungal-type domain-containing protein n=1 Tax=Saxophila tyrrhenica TaxID=1690608 RepID=A0AAV9PLZ3_9PEZI|nr:hypothetical protein LTR77_000191 [Saxophila tyrrhenica]